jgi:hypothetical protein
MIKQKENKFTTTIEVKDKHDFAVEIDQLDKNTVEIKLFDFADVKSCLASGLEMVALRVATPEEVKKACQEAQKHEKVPEKLIKDLALLWDSFLNCYMGFVWGKSREEVKKIVEKKIEEMVGKK